MPFTPSELLERLRTISVEDYDAIVTIIVDVYSRRGARQEALAHPFALRLEDTDEEDCDHD